LTIPAKLEGRTPPYALLSAPIPFLCLLLFESGRAHDFDLFPNAIPHFALGSLSGFHDYLVGMVHFRLRAGCLSAHQNLIMVNGGRKRKVEKVMPEYFVGITSVPIPALKSFRSSQKIPFPFG